MKNNYRLLCATSFFLLTVFSYAQSYTAPVSLVKQDQTEWCWAADSKCILDYYGIVKSQCTIVDYARTVRTDGYFGTKNCCPLASGICNKANEIKQNYGIKGMLDNFGKISSAVTPNTVSVANVISELKAKRPFILGISWNGGGGHVVVGCGYNETTGSLTFMDSWANNGMTTRKYAGSTAFSTNSGSGTIIENLVILSVPLDVATVDGFSNQVGIFPNPAPLSQEVIINSDWAIKSINVYNNIGQLVNNYGSISDKSFSIKMPATGLYSVQVITEKGTANKKIVVQ